MLTRRQNSTVIYNKIQKDGLLGRLHWWVYDTLFRNGPLTQMETTRYSLKLDRSSVSPRFTELIRMGCLQECGKRICKVTGRSSKVFDVTNTLPDKAKRKLQIVPRKELVKTIRSLNHLLETPLTNGLKQMASKRLSPQAVEWVQHANLASRQAEDMLKNM